jgi:hypothetical protein
MNGSGFPDRPPDTCLRGATTVAKAGPALDRSVNLPYCHHLSVNPRITLPTNQENVKQKMDRGSAWVWPDLLASRKLELEGLAPSSPNLRPRQSGALHYGISHSFMACAKEISPTRPHPVEADRLAQDCFVGLDDLLVFAAEWLAPDQL